jgi:DNA-binding MarR family transcriptional regulator
MSAAVYRSGFASVFTLVRSPLRKTGLPYYKHPFGRAAHWRRHSFVVFSTLMLFVGTMSCFDSAYETKNVKITIAEIKMTSPNANEMVEAVRRFPGFYARHIAAPHECFEHSRFSQTEMRVLYALMRAHACTAAEIARQLDLDTGYLSRLLMQFENEGLLVRRRSVQDKRRWLISLTTPGHAALEPPCGGMQQAVSMCSMRSSPENASSCWTRWVSTRGRRLDFVVVQDDDRVHCNFKWTGVHDG